MTRESTNSSLWYCWNVDAEAVMIKQFYFSPFILYFLPHIHIFCIKCNISVEKVAEGSIKFLVTERLPILTNSSNYRKHTASILYAITNVNCRNDKKHKQYQVYSSIYNTLSDRPIMFSSLLLQNYSKYTKKLALYNIQFVLNTIL